MGYPKKKKEDLYGRKSGFKETGTGTDHRTGFRYHKIQQGKHLYPHNYRTGGGPPGCAGNSKNNKYEHVLPLLAGIEESEEIDGLLLLLNTVGGDIEAGLAIAEMIAGMKKPTVSLVLGGGHSIGIPLAVCTKKSFITHTASMTVHPVRMTGLVVGAPQTFRYFQRIQEQIADFVTANSRISREDFENYMMATGEMATDVGTILYGRDAVASGLIDKLGGLNDALSALHKMIEKQKK